ncbi:MAG TPA: hypothetical protein VKL40_09535 [Candidatus Angelobacter sp.]|nr:hypothetical protein [Candidatus Angelobacter sp.]
MEYPAVPELPELVELLKAVGNVPLAIARGGKADIFRTQRGHLMVNAMS